MAVTAEDIEQYNGKKVLLTVPNPDTEGESVELEGKAEAANAMGVLFKPKGRSNLELYELGNIVSITFAPEKEKKLTAKILRRVEYGNAKQHLGDRHGYTLESLNAMNEQEAYDFHKGVNHVEQDLSHVHGDKPDKTKANADASDEAAESDTDE